MDAQALAHIAEQRSKGLCGAGKPFVLVVLGACATDLTVAASAFDAVVWAGSGGERGGEAITRVLFGLDVPSGKRDYQPPVVVTFFLAQLIIISIDSQQSLHARSPTEDNSN